LNHPLRGDHHPFRASAPYRYIYSCAYQPTLLPEPLISTPSSSSSSGSPPSLRSRPHVVRLERLSLLPGLPSQGAISSCQLVRITSLSSLPAAPKGFMRKGRTKWRRCVFLSPKPLETFSDVFSGSSSTMALMYILSYRTEGNDRAAERTFRQPSIGEYRRKGLFSSPATLQSPACSHPICSCGLNEPLSGRACLRVPRVCSGDTRSHCDLACVCRELTALKKEDPSLTHSP
jgi:hypothetical protein